MPTKTKRTAKPTVSVIGVGRLGTAIAIALEACGYRVVSLVGRRRHQVRKAVALLDARCEILIAKEMASYRPAELIIVAVPDDSIAKVSEALGQILLKASRPTVVHTSGALSSDVFAKLAKKGWHTGSLHPLVSVSDPHVGVSAFQKSFWCVEGDAVGLRLARQVVRDLGGSSFTIHSQDKPLYHAAAVMSSGHVMALFDVAIEMLKKSGLSRNQAQTVLLPLLKSTVTNLAQLKPEKALTGPFSRGDLATIKMHLSALRGEDLNEAQKLYRLLGKHALKLARKNMSTEFAEEINRRLR